MVRLCTILLWLCYVQMSVAQTVILGAGNTADIEVTASSEYHWAPGGGNIATGMKTISGAGLDMKRMAASRFLAQASLGYDKEDIEEVLSLGEEGWMNKQLDAPGTGFLDLLSDVHAEVADWNIQRGADSTEYEGRPYYTVFNYAWWEMIMKNDDLLRNRVAYALSQILVISANSDLEGHGDALASYYEIFLRNASGNYRDILREVSLHPAMGYFLSHLNNPKANPEENIHPDENYAREFMQLFSIGLYELNLDGTRKQVNGEEIPTYGQKEIKEFAKIWTGLAPGGVMPNEYDINEAEFGLDIYLADMTVPMQMHSEYHEEGPKELLNGVTIPAGQDGMKDIDDAIDNVFNHPNVGPFVAQRLIQRLVKSNPSPGYISRVSEIFNDNGEGVRGDMRGLLKAILLDEEARSCQSLQNPDHGMLREPLVRYTHYAKVLDIEQYYDRFWNAGYSFWGSTGQSVFGAPSVFNFYLPDFRPNGQISDRNLVAPEFQIHNSRTSIEFMNHVNGWTMYDNVMNGWEEDNPAPFINKERLKHLARDPEVLINELDVLFTHGQLSDRTRDLIRIALNAQIYRDYREDRVELAIYLIMISPDYAILR